MESVGAGALLPEHPIGPQKPTAPTAAWRFPKTSWGGGDEENLVTSWLPGVPQQPVAQSQSGSDLLQIDEKTLMHC